MDIRKAIQRNGGKYIGDIRTNNGNPRANNWMGQNNGEYGINMEIPLGIILAWGKKKWGQLSGQQMGNSPPSGKNHGDAAL